MSVMAEEEAKQVCKIVKEAFDALYVKGVNPCDLMAALDTPLYQADKEGTKYPCLWEVWSKMDQACLKTSPAYRAAGERHE